MSNFLMLTKVLIIVLVNLAIGIHAGSSEDCLRIYEKRLKLKSRAADYVEAGPGAMKDIMYISQAVSHLPITALQGLGRATMDTPGPLALFPGIATIIVPLGMVPFTTAAGLVIPLVGVPGTGIFMLVNWARIPKSFKRDHALYALMYDIATERSYSRVDELKKIYKNSDVKRRYSSKDELFADLKKAYKHGFFCQPSEHDPSDIKILNRREIIKQIGNGNLSEFLSMSP